MGLQYLLLLLLLLVLGLTAGGCAGPLIVEPSPPLQNPVTVLLLDHGRHSSLVLPGRDHHHALRYSYGDQAYYAHNKTGLFRAVSAVILPTSAVLGRRELPGPVDPERIGSLLRVGVDRVIPLQVESYRVSDLRTYLDTIYLQGYDSRLYSEELDLEFVRHPTSYTLLNNSNYVVANWLRQLDVKVHGKVFLSNWQFFPAGDE